MLCGFSACVKVGPRYSLELVVLGAGAYQMLEEEVKQRAVRH